MPGKQVPQTVTVADTKNILRDTTDKGDSTPTRLSLPQCETKHCDSPKNHGHTNQS